MFLWVMWWMGCKKCYHCQNACERCVYTGSNFTLSQTVCRDSFTTVAEYDTTIAINTALGYVCTATAPTYNEDFCVNKPGEANYPDYYNKGGRVTCTPKQLLQ